MGPHRGSANIELLVTYGSYGGQQVILSRGSIRKLESTGPEDLRDGRMDEFLAALVTRSSVCRLCFEESTPRS